MTPLNVVLVCDARRDLANTLAITEWRYERLLRLSFLRSSLARSESRALRSSGESAPSGQLGGRRDVHSPYLPHVTGMMQKCEPCTGLSFIFRNLT